MEPRKAIKYQVSSKFRLPAKLRGQFFAVYARAAALWDSQHWRMTPAITTHVNKTMHNLLTHMRGRGKHKEGDDAFRRLPHADMRNTLGLANPLALIDRQQLRFLGRLLRDHRRRPTTVTVVFPGRLDSAAYPGLLVGSNQSDIRGIMQIADQRARCFHPGIRSILYHTAATSLGLPRPFLTLLPHA
jgi:hypothetical protein